MSVTRFVGTALKGAAVGAANVIPGVSGGTIALISGIYQELIDTLKSFGWGQLKQLSQRQFKKCFESLNGPFVCALPKLVWLPASLRWQNCWKPCWPTMRS